MRRKKHSTDRQVDAQDITNHQAPGLRNALTTAMRGHRVDATGTGDIRDQLRAIGGASARSKSGIDTRHAAQQLGVDQRTVQRWIAAANNRDALPPDQRRHASTGISAGNGTKVRRAAQQAVTTKAGRRESIQALRARLGHAAINISFSGSSGPSDGGQSYMRNRAVTVPGVSPDQQDALFDAYIDGGERGFMDAFTQQLEDGGWVGWKFEDVEHFHFTRPEPQR